MSPAEGGTRNDSRPACPDEPSRLLSGRLGRGVIAAGVCGILFLLAAHSIKLDIVVRPHGNITRGDGTMLGAVRDQGQIRLVTFYIGLAARDAAGGRVTRIVAPADLSDLAVIPGAENTIGAYSGYYLQQMSGDGLESRAYDVTLSPAQVTALRRIGGVREYPKNVIGISGSPGDGSVVLLTDDTREHVYVVSSAVLREVRP